MKKKLDLGSVILLASLLVGILSGMRVTAILENFLFALIAPTTLKLVGSILLIFTLGNLLNEGGNLKNINSSLEAFIRDRRVTLVIPSTLIGLLPVTAGAMLSAPIVEESGNKMGLTPENKTFLNYWFRHIWEYTWPLYPGLVLTSAILSVPLYRIVLAQLPLTLSAIFSGCIFGLSRLPYKFSSKKGKEEVIKGICSFLLSAWPILAIIFFVLVLKWELILSLLIIVGFTLATTRIKRERIFFVLKNSLSWRIVLLIVSVMVFKRVLEASGVLVRMPEVFNYAGISPLFVLFFLPFFIGLSTGVTTAFVGIAFPILLPFIGIDNPNLTYVMLAYAGGFTGVLLSPVHLCLIVTKDYFKADFAGVYKLLLLPVLFVVLVAFMIVLVQNFIS
ncbi:hypothetical protein DRZ78_03255 [Candidatus Aerophobetes bacterium]|uniref:DUF401 family protein n=1 Tax=Aerophobetes bacterium TaxID=2030807 RepID=A0A662D4C8_UNCAE|nr:MAG: hypothetical protein DRZ78_03255 [Candidatus Aerophobetes bacterium]